MQMFDDIPVWGEPVDQGALNQIKTCRLTANFAALMADNHKGYAAPIGSVLAYYDKISPSGVGYDIACGNKAVRLDVPASEIRKNIDNIMNDIWNNIAFGVGKNCSELVDDALFDDPAWSFKALAPLKQMAREQLGSIGSGNHFVDLFEDENGMAWVGIHCGSRGLGHKAATYFFKTCGAKDGMDVPPLVIPVNSEVGLDYLMSIDLIGRYAYAGRNWICGKVARLLGANIVEEVHNHHNFAWREEHHGRKLWVVRKGGTPCFPGQKCFVGGSMGDISVILEGVEHPDTYYSLHSTVHGAGRVMSRTAAKGKVNRKTGAVISEGLVTKEMMFQWLKEKGVTLKGAGTDEAPQAYKRLPEVLAHHKNTIRIVHTLNPIGVAMAGGDEREGD